LAIGACTAEPSSRPAVVTAVGTGKSLAEFRQDDSICRQAAATRSGVAPAGADTVAAIAGVGTPEQRYKASYAQCITARGYRVVQGSDAYPLVATDSLPTVGDR